MTIQECYEAIGGNYEDFLGSINSEELIRKLKFMLLEDTSYMRLKQALSDKKSGAAFRNPHTVKGDCQNLSFERLYEVSY